MCVDEREVCIVPIRESLAVLKLFTPTISYVLLSMCMLDLYNNTTRTNILYHSDGCRVPIHKQASLLIPRPSHCPVFDHLQYGGGRPGSFYYVNDVSVYLGRQTG